MYNLNKNASLDEYQIWAPGINYPIKSISV